MRDAVSWLACGLLLPGIYLMGRKRASGFALGLLANVLWALWATLMHAWAVLVESLVIVAVYGHALWGFRRSAKPPQWKCGLCGIEGVGYWLDHQTSPLHQMTLSKCLPGGSSGR